jgi:hypothetical protein
MKSKGGQDVLKRRRLKGRYTLSHTKNNHVKNVNWNS